MLRYFHDVPYPSDLVNHDAGFYAPQASDPLQAADELKAYVNAQWNAAYRRAHPSY